jgi:hypothetical protein
VIDRARLIRHRANYDRVAATVRDAITRNPDAAARFVAIVETPALLRDLPDEALGVIAALAGLVVCESLLQIEEAETNGA